MFKSVLPVALCYMGLCLCGSTVEAYCSAEQSIACIRDMTRVLKEFLNNPRASKMQELCDSQRQSWACLTSHGCDVSASESTYRRTMELCNGNAAASDVQGDCSAGLDCVRGASNVLNEFVRNPQYNTVTMRKLCNAMRDMRDCLNANQCTSESFEDSYRRTMVQCNRYFRGAYLVGSSNNTIRAKRAVEAGGSIVEPLFEGASVALLRFRREVY